MNTHLGLIGKKLGNTQLFNEDGSVTSVTAIAAGPCVVVGKRSVERDGYTALQLGLGTRRPSRTNKPAAGQFKKLGVEAPEILREFRVGADVADRFEVGQTIKASEVFEVGQLVDVAGTSKGRGFTGVMKRYNFSGVGTIGHGAHEAKRHGGSIGMNMTPARTLPKMKMPGQHGNKRTTILGLRVAGLVDNDNMVLVAGGVPGPCDGIVTLRPAVKAPAAS